MSETLKKYNSIQISLHWLSAALIIFMLFMGEFVLSDTPNSDPNKINALKGHMIFGGLIFFLILFRIIWKKKSPQPAAFESGNPMQDKVAVIMHYALNIFTLLVALSGMGIAIQAGLPDIVFNGMGALPENFNDFAPRLAHGLLTKLLLFMIAIHALAGIYHQFILKDGLMDRMSFKK